MGGPSLGYKGIVVGMSAFKEHVGFGFWASTSRGSKEAKRDETRAKRMATTVAWVTEGKSRNWKYIT